MRLVYRLLILAGLLVSSLAYSGCSPIPDAPGPIGTPGI